MSKWIKDNGGENFSNPNPAWWLGCALIISGCGYLALIVCIILRFIP